jgi:phosphatidylglycerophosphate synthase
MTTESKGFQEAARSQESLLAPLERVCLTWLARHTPHRIHSDHLTALGLVAMLLAGLTYAAARWWAPALLVVDWWIAVNWLGDSLDGTLARVRNKLRPRYGFYVDHIVDAFGSLFLIAGLAASGYMSEWVALGLLLGYFLLSIDAYLATYTLGAFHLSFWKFSPTEMRILLAVGNAAAFLRPHVLGGRYLFFDVAGSIALLSIGLVLLISVARHTRTLYLAERI